MPFSRRSALLSVAASLAQLPDQNPQQHPPEPEPEDDKLPNGKSRRDLMAASDHKEAVKDAAQLVALANEIKADLDKAGAYVVPLATVKKTEEIEKLARRIRGRLKT